MVNAKYEPLSSGARFFLILFALILLQCNVPVQSRDALQICADFSLPVRQHNCLQPTYRLLAAITSQYQCLQQLLTHETVAKTYRIVKVESKHSLYAHIWPVRGGISSGYGMRKHPITRRNSFHYGIDIKARQGTSILCPSDGVVVSAGRAGLLGRLVKVKTRDGKMLYFGHMHRIKCSRGQLVRRGQMLGTVGSSGRATGPHLHFSVAASGRYINPLKYLSAN